ncbi:MAG: hypothetical protein KF861_14655 [Planctomycetaceae bacterium]|nr:hypothetical protein [Planctomycetaceae bacterium]
MRMITLLAACLSIVTFQSVPAADEPGAITAEEVSLDRPVDFRQDVLPIFRAKCLACHSESVKEGELTLETVEGLLHGGDSGPAVVAGKPDESLVYLQASRQQESFMPPLPNKANAGPLTPREVGILKLWIQEGAKTSQDTGPAIAWQSLPSGLHPIYSLALSPDETLVAAGRGNRIAIYDLVRQRPVAMLSDPVLGDIAHRDFVHTLDFSPDGQWLASGGYRVVKLWKKTAPLEEERELEAGVTHIAVSPDGQWIATARPDGSIRLEPRIAGGDVRTLAGTGAPVVDLAFTPDSAVLLSASGQTVQRWSVSDATLTGVLTAPGPVTVLLTSADGTQVVTGHADGAIRIWSNSQLAAPTEGTPAEPAMPQSELRGGEQSVAALAWIAADAPRLASGGEDGKLRLWDVTGGTEVLSIDQGTSIVDAANSPDGKQLAVLGGDGVVHIWDGAGAKVAELSGDPRRARRVSDAKDELSVAQARKSLAEAAVGETEKDITSRDESLKKANEQLAAAQKAVEEAKPKLAEAQQKQQAATDAAAAKPDDEALKNAQAEAEKATQAAQDAAKKADEGLASAQRGVELSEKSLAAAKAELESRKQQRDAEVAGETLANEAVASAETAAQEAAPVIRWIEWTLDGSALATADGQGLVTLWHVGTQRPLATISTDGPFTGWSTSADGRFLACTESGRLLVLQPEPHWQLAGQLGPTDESGADLTSSVLLGRVLAIDFSPDSARLATGSGEASRSGQLMLWNVAEQTLEREIPEAHSDTVFAVAFSRDGLQLASCAADKFAKIFDAGTGALKNTFEGHTGHVHSVAWLADGSRLATGGADNAIKVWNTATGEQARTINSHQKPVLGLTFIGITENIASAGGDKAVLLHTASNGKNYRRCDGSTDFVHAIVASRDESLVIAGGEDGALRVWNGKDGKLITTFDPPAAPAASDAQAAR